MGVDIEWARVFLVKRRRVDTESFIAPLRPDRQKASRVLFGIPRDLSMILWTEWRKTVNFNVGQEAIVTILPAKLVIETCHSVGLMLQIEALQ